MNNYISHNIRFLVSRRKLSNDKYGELFGLNRGAVLSYVQGVSKPKIETLQKISTEEGFTIDELVNVDISKKVTNNYNIEDNSTSVVQDAGDDGINIVGGKKTEKVVMKKNSADSAEIIELKTQLKMIMDQRDEWKEMYDKLLEKLIK